MKTSSEIMKLPVGTEFSILSKCYVRNSITDSGFSCRILDLRFQLFQIDIGME